MKMSLRVLKPRRVRLSPCDPPSPAERLIPGTLRSASRSEVLFWSSISWRGTEMMDCGVSRSGSVSLDSAGVVTW